MWVREEEMRNGRLQYHSVSCLCRVSYARAGGPDHTNPRPFLSLRHCALTPCVAYGGERLLILAILRWCRWRCGDFCDIVISSLWTVRYAAGMRAGHSWGVGSAWVGILLDMHVSPTGY